MKKLFTLMAVLACVSFVACDDNEDLKGWESLLKVTSKTNLSYQKSGGEGAIEFVLYRPVAGQEVQVNCDAEWIENIVKSDLVAEEHPELEEGETIAPNAQAYLGVITFNVPENTTGADRVAKIDVSYGDQFTTIIVKQGAIDEVTYDYEYELLDYKVTYYDDYAAEGIHNYYVMAFIKGPTADNKLQANDFIIQFDIYSDVAPQGANFIPAGTYTFDASDSFAPGTMSNKYTSLYITNSSAVVKSNVKIIEGSITVTANGFEGAVVTADDASSIHFVYKGETGGSGEPTPEPEPTALSTLTGDVTFEDVNAQQKFTAYGDAFGIGMDVYVGQVISDSHCMTFQLMVPGGSETLEGVYEVVPANGQVDPTKYYFFEGGVQNNNIAATWYLNQETEEMGPIVDGTIEIQVWASGYTFYDVDVVDDAGNSIKGTFLGSEPSSSLEGDVEFDVTDGIMAATAYGDAYEVGMDNIGIEMMESDFDGHGFMLDFLVPTGTTSLEGTYVSAFGENSVLMGGTADHLFVPQDYNLYMVFEEGEATTETIIADGTIVVESVGEKKYKFTFDVVTEGGVAIKGTFVADDYTQTEESAVKKTLKPVMSNTKVVAPAVTKSVYGVGKTQTFTMVK